MNIENSHIEYKRELTDNLEKEIVAFLNYHEGGILYIGIDNKGVPVGISDADIRQLQIKDRLKNNILPSCLGLFDILLEKRKNKNIIKIIVASGPEKPYYLRKYGMSEKGAYIRSGSSSEQMPVRMIESLFAKRTRNSIGKIKSPNQKLSFEQLKIYYQAVGKTLNEHFAENLELLTENNEYNYVAYLLADANGLSVKTAKYDGTDRVALSENNEYGYCSLIKATKQILDKIDLENKTLTQITPKERKQKRLWNPIALREAVINAIVHNDYTKEIPPKFEFFSDRIEITSSGGLPEGLNQEEFFEGFSVPRNKELMRIFKDLELVEQLGSGVPRILLFYSRDCFKFSENFFRMIFAAEQDTEQDTVQDTEQVSAQVEKLIMVFDVQDESVANLMKRLGLKHRPTFLSTYLNPALKSGLAEMTIPDKPTSKLQKYRITSLGLTLKNKLLRNKKP